MTEKFIPDQYKPTSAALAIKDQVEHGSRLVSHPETVDKITINSNTTDLVTNLYGDQSTVNAGWLANILRAHVTYFRNEAKKAKDDQDKFDRYPLN
jgi:hypothetical protein